jgi:uncharacterized membrane protein YphA (DoxX/SURF4 family)
MKYLTHIARIVLGLAFFVFGLNGFINFIPPPPDAIPKAAMDFSMAMINTGYLLQLVKGTEVLVGALLLMNRFVPLALVIIAPVIVNIVAFHAFLAPSGMVIPIVLVVAALYLAWVHRHAFKPLLQARSIPASAGAR